MITYIYMSWTITFFNEKVEEETLSFPDGILANFLHISEMIEEFGPTIGKPHTAPMGGGLFEIRAKGREGIGRSLFCSVKGKEIVILHSFIKKTQRTPKRELDKARKRQKEVG
jgi:phage-related protein